jgi:hypothetical protein
MVSRICAWWAGVEDLRELAASGLAVAPRSGPKVSGWNMHQLLEAHRKTQARNDLRGMSEELVTLP